MIDELLRALRSAMPFQMAWSRNRHHLHVCQLSRDQRGHCRLSKGYGDIRAITHQIADLLAGDNVQRALRMQIEKRPKSASKHAAGNDRIDGKTEPAAHDAITAASSIVSRLGFTRS
jgi:hypothetical protein